MNIKQVSISIQKLFGVFIATVFVAGTAHAVPELTLDIEGGTYDTVQEDIVAPDSTFTLLALLNPPARHGNEDADEYEARVAAYFSETYFISIALTPQTSADGDYGSITVGSTTVDITDDMAYGLPPLDESLVDATADNDKDEQDLIHSGDIFPTFFWESTGFQFSFDGEQCVEYDSQTSRDGCVAGTGIWVVRFDIDASLLAEGYGLHIDFYSTILNGTDTDRDAFAPFSHDARYDCCRRKIPEPGTLGLLGIGLLGLGFARRRKVVA